MKIQRGKWQTAAFTLPELLVIVAILLVMILVVIPGAHRGRAPAYGIKCFNNLKLVGLAFRIFATDNGDQFPFTISTNKGGSRELHPNGDPFAAFQVLSNELSTPRIVVCPKDTRREATSWTNFSNRNVSYFLNTNAVETATPEILAGDRNIEVNSRPIATGRFEIPSGSSMTFDKRIHQFQGSVCMTDGSVQQLSNARLLSLTNHNPYVLAVP